MDGYEATRQIRLLEAGKKRTPVVALTAHSMAGDAEKCFAAGMDDCLFKPFDIGQILAVLEKYSLPDGTASNVAAVDSAASDEKNLIIEPLEKQRVLIVDDEPMNIKLLLVVLQEDYQISVATSGKEALAIAHSAKPPDIILLDVMMPEMDGYEVCGKLKAEPETQEIPIIFLTAVRDETHAELGLKLGAVDYIVKPFSLPIIRAKLKNHLELKRYKDKLKAETWTDGLTQIANRRRFNETYSMEMRRSKRLGTDLSVLMVDIDFFKNYNDTYGHLAGDDCLRKVAHALHKALQRPGDLIARWGGEEFSCLLPNTDRQGAAVIGERLRKAVADLDLPHETSPIGKSVTVSIGLATSNPVEDISDDDLMKQADDALYEAKRTGRNRVFQSAT